MSDLFLDLSKPEKRDPDAPKPHCQKCGRFVKNVWSPTGPDITGDWETSTGVCKVHGGVYVSWEGE